MIVTQINSKTQPGLHCDHFEKINVFNQTNIIFENGRKIFCAKNKCECKGNTIICVCLFHKLTQRGLNCGKPEKILSSEWEPCNVLHNQAPTQCLKEVYTILNHFVPLVSWFLLLLSLLQQR